MSEIRKVAILGAGHGGCCAAADLTLRGYDVRLHSRSSGRLASLAGGITLRGVREGIAKPHLMTTDLKSVVEHVDLVMLVVPSIAHEYYAQALAPLLTPGMIVFLNPGHTGGALHFASSLAKANAPSVLLCETVTLTYICRMEGSTTVAMYRETTNLRFAAIPAHQTQELVRRFRPIFPNLKPAAHVLETGLMNINAVIHPPGMLMNTGWIEYKNGDFLFYKEGITPAVARVIEAVDRERLAIGSKFGLLLPAFIDYFCEAGLTSEAARQSRSVYRAMQESHPNRTIKSPPSLNHRYLHEDVGYGLVPMVEFGRLANISTPTMESLITLSSIAQGVDYCREGLTLQQMSLEGLSIEELLKVVTEGNSARHKK